MSETKARFLAEYDRPVPAMYETVLQELLVQQHFLRYNKKYQYDEARAPRHAPRPSGTIPACPRTWLLRAWRFRARRHASAAFAASSHEARTRPTPPCNLSVDGPPARRCAQIFALGLVSVFDQILDEMPGGESGAVFNAYITSLGEKPEQYKKDAAALTELATAASGAEELKPDGDGTEVCVVRAACSSQLRRVRSYALALCATPLVTLREWPVLASALMRCVHGVGRREHKHA